MSFDQEPERRTLLYHPESDCLFVEYCISRVEEILSTGEVEDVTGLGNFESRFLKQVEEV